jgi:hypothetical protein
MTWKKSILIHFLIKKKGILIMRYDTSNFDYAIWYLELRFCNMIPRTSIMRYDTRTLIMRYDTSNTNASLNLCLDWCSGNALDLYSGFSRFETRPGLSLTWLKFHVVFLSPSRQIPKYYIEEAVAAAKFFQNSSFICHSTIRRRIIWLLAASQN